MANHSSRGYWGKKRYEEVKKDSKVVRPSEKDEHGAGLACRKNK